MKKQELYNKVIAYFQEAMPVAETELHYNNPFELLIAVILSAQCTDKRVNMITPPLYRDFPTPEAFVVGRSSDLVLQRNGKYDHPSSLPGFPDS